MKTLAGVAVLVAFCVGVMVAQTADGFEPPSWAYPVMDEGRGRGPDDGTLHSVEGSDLQLTQTQINDRFAPPDWYPDEHPPMPEVVAHGRQPLVRACAQCHMPHGAGHPESASLAGLPADYIFEQTLAYQRGTRKSLVSARSASMIEIAAEMTEEEMRIAAEYFASLPPVKWITVIEADMVPETYVGAGNMRHAERGGGMEPIGNRIVEIPENSELADLRTYIAEPDRGRRNWTHQAAARGRGVRESSTHPARAWVGLVFARVSISNDRMRISMKPVGCGARICEGTQHPETCTRPYRRLQSGPLDAVAVRRRRHAAEPAGPLATIVALELRDSHSPFMAYVPPSSVAAGKELAAGDGRGALYSVLAVSRPGSQGSRAGSEHRGSLAHLSRAPDV